jgi:hypothetical protein
VRKPEGKRPLGKPRRRWKDNIKIALQEVYRIRWIGSLWHSTGTQALVNAKMNFRFP